MIVFVFLVVLLLLIACALFVLPALGYGVKSAAMSRDQLNTRFYQSRLDELAHDEREGVVSERALHIEDLQRVLLANILAAPATALGAGARGGGVGRAGAVCADRRCGSGSALAADGEGVSCAAGARDGYPRATPERRGVVSLRGRPARRAATSSGEPAKLADPVPFGGGAQ